LRAQFDGWASLPMINFPLFINHLGIILLVE
jgi:hypothetical protein